MDINDERLGPLCGDGRKTWMAYRIGPWEGKMDEVKSLFYINNSFNIRSAGREGYLTVSELYLPLEYCL